MSDTSHPKPGLAPSRRLALAGFVGTAVAFGPARMGFGLFLPAIREDFALSASSAGLIASASFVMFLLGLLVAAWLAVHMGPRLAVAAGALLAVAGFATVARAESVAMLAVGVALAGSSAGLCWTPFNDAAVRVVPEPDRPGILSAVSTGTTMGVAAAGALALMEASGFTDWRMAWSGFAGLGALALLLALIGVPGGRGDLSGRARSMPVFWRSDTRSLYGVALVFGLGNGAYITFAADSVVGAGGLSGLSPDSAAAVIFISYGAFGIVGLTTGWLEARLGMQWVLSLVLSAFALSMLLVAILPGSWAGVIASAGLHGAGVMVISAVLSLWSLRRFPDHRLLGFTAALFLVAIGSVLGAPLAGALIDLVGMKTTFLGLALPLALTAIIAAPKTSRAKS